MIGHARLRVIIGADFLAAFACANLGASGGVLFRLALLVFNFIQTRPQHAHRAQAVLQLGTLVLTGDDYTGREVGDAHGGHVLLNVLPASAGRTVHIHLNIRFGDINLHVFNFRQDGHGNRGRVDAPLGFGLGHALDAVHAGFELQTGIGAFAFHRESDFFIAANADFICGEDFGLVVMQVGIAQVHAQQVGRKEGGLIAAGAGPNFYDNVAIVARVFWDQEGAQFSLNPVKLFAELLKLLFGEFAHFAFSAAKQGFCLFQLRMGGVILLGKVDHGLKF